MGAPKQKWTAEEEEALRRGVVKHGAGKWRTIQKDPQFSHYLAARSNIDLKDKWRNMSVSASGQGSRERSRGGQKTKTLPGSAAKPICPSKSGGPDTPATQPTCPPKSVAPATQLTCPPKSAAPAAPATQSTCPPKSATPALLKQDAALGSASYPPKRLPDLKTAPRYNMMIIEALSEMQDSNGSEISAICKFIEGRHSVPSNFRRFLSSKLRRLVAQNKIEKVQNLYKLKDFTFATKTPTPKQKDPINRSKAAQTKCGAFVDTIEEDAKTAAYLIAEAEAKSFLASEAVKETEKFLRMVEESDSMVQLAKEILEQCARGEIITMA